MKKLARPEYWIPLFLCVVVGSVFSVVGKPMRTAAVQVSLPALRAGDVAGDAYAHVVRVLGAPDIIDDGPALAKHPTDVMGVAGTARLQERTIVYTKARVEAVFTRDRPIDGRPRKWWLVAFIGTEKTYDRLGDAELSERMGRDLPAGSFVADDVSNNDRLWSLQQIVARRQLALAEAIQGNE